MEHTTHRIWGFLGDDGKNQGKLKKINKLKVKIKVEYHHRVRCPLFQLLEYGAVTLSSRT
jgi:hypothetical protein